MLSSGRWRRCLNFNPRPPRGGRPWKQSDVFGYEVFQSTPSARRATRAADGAVRPIQISIHALREEGDSNELKKPKSVLDFNPRPPRGGRPPCLPVCTRRGKYFNPRPPRGGRLQQVFQLECFLFISIHALREEGDLWPLPLGPRDWYFNPRPPRGGRPVIARRGGALEEISIHALREEGDGDDHGRPLEAIISIHALREEGDRDRRLRRGCFEGISIHALREEGDPSGLIIFVW